MNLIFPKPPSINHIYGYTSGGGFARSYITKAGKEWFESAITEIEKEYKAGNITTKLEVPIHLDIVFYTKREQDIDNILKPILDSLGSMCLECHSKKSARKSCECGKNHSVLVDDKQIIELHVVKHKIKTPDIERVELDITY